MKDNVIDLAQYKRIRQRDSPKLERSIDERSLRDKYRSDDEISQRCDDIKKSLMRIQQLMDELKSH